MIFWDRYDVYVGNARGSVYSLGHSHLRTYSRRFFEISFQSIEYDIKKFIGFIHEETKKRVIYVGHSQGATAMLAALSDPLVDTFSNVMEPMLDSVHLLAPVVFLVNKNYQIREIS